MNTRNLVGNAAVTSIALLLGACGSSATSYESEEQPELGAASQQIETPSTADSNYVSAEALSNLGDVPDTRTAALVVLDDFTFETSRDTTVSMYIPEAVGVGAEASFCTDYTRLGDGRFDVDYDSCVLSAPLVGGYLEEEIDLVNQHDRVLGVVWFQDPAMDPMYREYQFN